MPYKRPERTVRSFLLLAPGAGLRQCRSSYRPGSESSATSITSIASVGGATRCGCSERARGTCDGWGPRATFSLVRGGSPYSLSSSDAKCAVRNQKRAVQLFVKCVQSEYRMLTRKNLKNKCVDTCDKMSTKKKFWGCLAAVRESPLARERGGGLLACRGLSNRRMMICRTLDATHAGLDRTAGPADTIVDGVALARIPPSNGRPMTPRPSAHAIRIRTYRCYTHTHTSTRTLSVFFSV